jgi:hypothetical protein
MSFYYPYARCVAVVEGPAADIEVDLGFGIQKKERVKFCGIQAKELLGPRPLEKHLSGLILGRDVALRTYKSKTDGGYSAVIFTRHGGVWFNVNESAESSGYADVGEGWEKVKSSVTPQVSQ